jgi:hypothetical protein
MINKTIRKIHNYRIPFLVLISFMFLAYLGLNPIDLSRYYGARFGSAVGMSMSIPENPVNKLALDLKKKEEALAAREQDLSRREAELINRPERDRLLIWLMGLGIIVLFLLISLNFYLDRRSRKK